MNTPHEAIYSVVGKVPHTDCINELDLRIEDLIDELHESFPSVYPHKIQVSKYDFSIADNQFVAFGINEYLGDVSVWVVPKYVPPNLTSIRDNWISMIENTFKKSVKKVFVDVK